MKKAAWTNRLTMFAEPRGTLDFTWKMMMMTMRPRMIGNRPALAAADPLHPGSDVLAERVGQDVGGGRDESDVRRRLMA